MHNLNSIIGIDKKLIFSTQIEKIDLCLQWALKTFFKSARLTSCKWIKELPKLR